MDHGPELQLRRPGKTEAHAGAARDVPAGRRGSACDRGGAGGRIGCPEGILGAPRPSRVPFPLRSGVRGAQTPRAPNKFRPGASGERVRSGWCGGRESGRHGICSPPPPAARTGSVGFVSDMVLLSTSCDQEENNKDAGFSNSCGLGCYCCSAGSPWAKRRMRASCLDAPPTFLALLMAVLMAYSARVSMSWLGSGPSGPSASP